MQTPRLAVDAKQLEKEIETFLSEKGVNACAVEVSDDGGSLFKHLSLSNEHYPIYSITKSFIGTLILQAVEEGKLTLESKIGDLITVPDWFRGATIWQLLCHRSGLGDYVDLKESYLDRLKFHPDPPPTEAELKKMAFDRGFLQAPDSGFLYSNPGYLLLVEVIEALYRKPFEQVLGEKILRPSGMETTYVLKTKSDLQNIAAGFSTFWTGSPVDIRPRYSPEWVSHRMLSSTTTELNLFLKAVFNGTLLKPASLALIKKPYKLDRPATWLQPSYGPSFLGDADSQFGSVLGHRGSGPGFGTVSYAIENRKQRYYISAVVNQDDVNLADELALLFIRKF